MFDVSNQSFSMRLLFIILLSLFLCISSGEAQGKLEQAQQAVHNTAFENDASDVKKPRRKRPHHEHCDELENGWEDLFWKGAFVVAAAPWWGPHVLIETEESQSGPVDFASFPYADGHEGYLVIESKPPSKVFALGASYQQEFGSDFSGITRTGGQLQVESADYRFGLDTEWDVFTEKLPSGSTFDLWTGDANLVVRFAQSEKLMMHSGIGINYLTATGQTDLGFNFTYSLDAFPVDPWVISADLDWGTLGHSSRFHLRGATGVTLEWVELFGGYDYERIGGQDLHGPMVGARFWW